MILNLYDDRGCWIKRYESNILPNVGDYISIVPNAYLVVRKFIDYGYNMCYVVIKKTHEDATKRNMFEYVLNKELVNTKIRL